MAETPETVEVNVVMGAQLRAIVRSALIHVRNKATDGQESSGEHRVLLGDVVKLIDEELVKWPLSVEPEDTLAEWLHKRFGPAHAPSDERNWEHMAEEDRLYWEHEADAVRRAVGRGGLKTSPDEVEISTPIGDLHQAHANSDNMVKGYVQLYLKHAETLGEAIRIAVGAASTCWTKLGEAGMFRPETALDIATQLEHYVMERINQGLGQIGQRHQALGSRLQTYRESGHTTVSIQQVYQILTGTGTVEEYNSPLQVRPLSENERHYRRENPNG